MNRRRLASLAGVLLTLACLAFLGYVLYRERDVLIAHLLTANPRQIAVIIAWYLIDLLIYIVGWASIMAHMGGHIGFVAHIRVFCAANMAKRLPGTIWYVGGRAALYNRAGIPARVVVAASAIEGALIWLSGVTLSIPFLMVIIPDRRWVWLGVGGLLLIAILNPWTLRRLLGRITEANRTPAISWLRIYGWLMLYMIGWAAGGVMIFMILIMFQVAPVSHLPTVIGGWTVAGTASMLTFFLPSGFGVTEVTLAFLLRRLVPAGVAALIAISARVIVTLLDVVFGGLAYLFMVAADRK